jgi:esterase/lipase superfamily enzyme
VPEVFKIENRDSRKGLLACLFFLSALMQGCHAPLECPVKTRLSEPPAPQLYFANVLFVTDRTPANLNKASFSSQRNLVADHLIYGSKCEDPAGRRSGCSESSTLFAKEEFFQQISDGRKDVLLFVPGFNYSFDESLQIALRIAERTKFDATVVSYSWPSRHQLLAYRSDYDSSEWSVEHLTGFLKQVALAVPEGKFLHIVAHSIGGRILLQALLRLQLPHEKLGELVMIAPDVDTQIFVEQAPKCGAFRRKTLYVSPRDKALQFSQFLFHSNKRRAGEEYIVLDGMETIDASLLHAGITGHAYFEESQLMLEDLGAVLRNRPVSERRLDACSVKSLDKKNSTNGSSMPLTIYRLPENRAK